ncbi:FAD:protein FMN transferase [uncultured Castellaniella sp.]|uniref:FAD:protein FMN transferase n=1 Tax=uncultured Castellaniella sp. TaxID=647907 RepID=UPI0026396ED7|nr:FAD:protein FMN transferase [uncultured Castellaniella sp.]
MTTATRRRFLGITAASAALLGASPLRAALSRPGELPEPVVWRGIALGADAEMQLLHPDRAHAQRLVRLAIGEIHRLESIFSLYRDDSALARLNRAGRLDAPPADLCRLMSEACGFATLTDGYFDPTVQPLWRWYVRQGLSRRPPAFDPDALRPVLNHVDHRAIQIEPDLIRFRRPAMEVTLNGIAQGYITDRVTELLRANGLEHAMIDLGEARGLGRPDASRPWRAGLADPSDRTRLMDTIELDDRALATSGGYGTPLDDSGALTHLFDPHTGSAMPRWRSASVRALDATTADALSTAFALMPESSIRAIISRLPVQAWLLPPDSGTLIRLG